MDRLVYILIFIIGISACSNYKYLNNNVPNSIKTNFSLCYNREGTGIDSLINIQGYYKQTKDMYKGEGITRSFEYTMFFFSDGLFARQFGDISDDSSAVTPIINAYEWGLYRVCGDTILLQYINHPSKMAPWGAWESMYVVVDRNTIKQINLKPMHYISGSYRNDLEEKWKSKYGIAKFVPLLSIPKPNCWLINEQWFWCNEINKE